MKGNNELRLNQATMIEVVQQWIDENMPKGAQTVTSVKPESGSLSGFVVSLSSDKDWVVFGEQEQK